MLIVLVQLIKNESKNVFSRKVVLGLGLLPLLVNRHCRILLLVPHSALGLVEASGTSKPFVSSNPPLGVRVIQVMGCVGRWVEGFWISGVESLGSRG